jgi:hypothetical protein
VVPSVLGIFLTLKEVVTGTGRIFKVLGQIILLNEGYESNYDRDA